MWASPPLDAAEPLDQVEDDVGARVGQSPQDPADRRRGGDRPGLEAPARSSASATARATSTTSASEAESGWSVGRIGALYRTATRASRRAHEQANPVGQARVEDPADQVSVADPVPFGQDHEVARHRGQAGQGVGLDEVGDAVADPEVDPGQVAAAERGGRRHGGDARAGSTTAVGSRAGAS